MNLPAAHEGVARPPPFLPRGHTLRASVYYYNICDVYRLKGNYCLHNTRGFRPRGTSLEFLLANDF